MKDYKEKIKQRLEKMKKKTNSNHLDVWNDRNRLVEVTENREHLSNHRRTKSDIDVSNTLESARLKVDRKDRELYRKARTLQKIGPNTINISLITQDNNYAYGKSSRMYMIRSLNNTNSKAQTQKLIDRLEHNENKYPYEIWEGIYVLRECIENQNGLMVKVNQKIVEDFIKILIMKSESIMIESNSIGVRRGGYRDYKNKNRTLPIREKSNDLDHSIGDDENNDPNQLRLIYKDTRNSVRDTISIKLTPDTDLSKRIKELVQTTSSSPLWKEYSESDEHLINTWKKAVLNKKSIRTESLTSWDRETYKKGWYDRIRQTTVRRRYIRPHIPGDEYYYFDVRSPDAINLTYESSALIDLRRKSLQYPIYTSSGKERIDLYMIYETNKHSDKRDRLIEAYKDDYYLNDYRSLLQVIFGTWSSIRLEPSILPNNRWWGFALPHINTIENYESHYTWNSGYDEEIDFSWICKKLYVYINEEQDEQEILIPDYWTSVSGRIEYRDEYEYDQSVARLNTVSSLKRKSLQKRKWGNRYD